MVAASMAPDHRRAPPLPAGVPGLAPPSRPLHRPSAASYGMSHPPPLRATPPPLPPPQPLPRSQETFRGHHRSLGGDLSTLGGDQRLSLPAPACRGRTSCAVPAPREANSTPGPHQLCCAGPTGTPARQGRTSSAVQAPQEPPHARAATAVLCRPHRNPRTPGPHQLCCAGPTGTPARQGRTSSDVQAPQEPPHARAAPALLCRPHRNPRTPGPHQLCCAGPTGTPARQGRTSCAVQAPLETPHARAAPAVLCRPHRKRAAPLHARARAVQGHAGRLPPPLSWGSGGRKQGESGPRRSPNRWSLQPAPPPRLRLAQVGSPSPPQRVRAPG